MGRYTGIIISTFIWGYHTKPASLENPHCVDFELKSAFKEDYDRWSLNKMALGFKRADDFFNFQY